MVFRGALQPMLQGWIGPIGGLALASLLFGIAHAANVGYFLISTVIGLCFGGLYMWTGDLIAPIIAHGVYDVYALQVTAVAVREYKAQAAAA